MRKLFWILLLANVAFFAAMQKGWMGLGEQVSQSQPPLHEDMIRLLGAPEAILPAPPIPPTPPATPAPPASPATAPVEPPVIEPPPAAARPDALACLEWGDFSGSDLTRATVALAALQLGDKLSQYQIEHDTGYWVYFPPLKNKAAVNRKISELKARGINEYFVVQNAGNLQNAISLGVFKTQEAAQNFLDELRDKGVRTAQVGERASKFKVTVFRLNGVGILTEARMAALQKDFAGSELKRVPCTH